MAARSGPETDPFRDAPDECRIRRDEDGLRRFVMLGLGKQVHRDPVRMRRTVADNQDFGRSGDHVDAHAAEHAPLRRGNIGVAGADYLVHLRNALGAVSQRRHCLRPTDGEYPVDASNIGRRQYQIVAFAVGGRHHHDYFRHACDLCGKRVHQHGGRIGRLSAGDIHADTIQRCDFLAQRGAVGLRVLPRHQRLALVIAADARGGLLECIPSGRGQTGARPTQLDPRNLERGERYGLELVKSQGVFEYCLIAARTYISQYRLDGTLDVLVLIAFEGQQLREPSFKTSRSGRQARDPGHTGTFSATARNASITG